MNKSVIFLLLSLILVTACGMDNGHFKLDGRLLNLNQGEFLIYSPDGAMPKADTIHVEGGRFELVTECVHEGTALIIMPNGMEMAVFVEPGASLTLKGDAQNLRMAEITGTDDNKVMNEFRNLANGKLDSQLQPLVKDIVMKHPESRVGMYLISRYILSAEKPDYALALKLLDKMQQEQEDNASVSVLRSQVKEQQKSSEGAKVPAFSVKDISGQSLTQKDFAKGVALVASWASWDYETQQQVRVIADIIRDKDDVILVALSLDGSPESAKHQWTGIDEKVCRVVCDGKMTDGSFAKAFAITQTGTVILMRDGKVTDRLLTGEDLYSKLREMLK